MYKRILIFAIFTLLLLAHLRAQQNYTPCFTGEEYRLFKLVNRFRVENGMEFIPASLSLTVVAKTHIEDLIKNQPDTSDCNMHSWSDKGNWTACCYNKQIKTSDCMQNKPSELTGYIGKGYELAFWDSQWAHPDSAYSLWINLLPSKEMILNQGNFRKLNWQAVGIAVKGPYALIWFGAEKDKSSLVPICNSNEYAVEKPEVEKITAPRDQSGLYLTPSSTYHIIFGSFNTGKDAEAAIAKYRKAGFSSAGIIKSDGNFRISLNSFSSLQQAKKSREGLSEEYRSAWILKY